MSSGDLVRVPLGPHPDYTAVLIEADGGVRFKGSLLLIHEIFGVNANMLATARAFAASGFHVLVPDLFWRVEPGISLDPAQDQDRQRGMQINAAFDDASGLEDLKIAAAAMHRRAGSRGVGSVGFCLGGRLSFALGAAGAVARAVSYYGVDLHRYVGPPHQSPTLVHIAQNDVLCPRTAQESLAAHFAGHPKVRLMSHPGVGHAFARIGSGAYAAEAAARAMVATLGFLVSE